MPLAAVRDLRPQLRLETIEEIGAFEQDLLAEFVMARSSAGITDATIRWDVGAVAGLREWFGRPLWEMTPKDLDTFFGRDQKDRASGTKVRKAAAFAVYFEFLELRHKPAIHAATGFAVESPIDEVNRPRGGTQSRLRIPPTSAEVGQLFTGWRSDISCARKYAPRHPELHRDAAGCAGRPEGIGAVRTDHGRRVLGPGAVRQDPVAGQGQPRPGQEGAPGPVDQRIPGAAGMVGRRPPLGVRRPPQRPGRAAVPLRATLR